MKSVGKEIAKGTIYNALARYASVVVNLIVTAILARILTPDDFGAVALTTVFIMFFDLLGNMGFGPAIIQNKSLNNRDLASIFNLTIVIAFSFALICFFLANPIANYYSNGQLVGIMRLLSLQVFFTIINVVPYSLILKSRNFRFISISTVICHIFYGLTAVIAAFCGLGLYSLLVSPIFSIITLFVIFSVKSRKDNGTYYNLCMSFVSIKKVLSFSIYQFLFNIVNYFSRNLDKLLIGSRFTMADLGYYEKSYRLMMLPISNISNVLTPTIQPVLSQFQDDKERLKAYVASIIQILAFVGFILSPLLFFCSKEIIIIVFGYQWLPAVPIFQILSISVFAQLIDSSSGSILQSANAPKQLFISGLICAIINITMIAIGVFIIKSLNGLAILLDIAFVFNLFIDIYFIFSVTLKENMCFVLKQFIHPFIISIIISISLCLLSIINIQNIFGCFIIKVLVVFVESFIYGYMTNLIDLNKVKKVIH